MLIRFALGFALFETLVLAGVLLAWADRVAGGRLLAAFLLGIAVWITGNELPNWLGADVWPVAKQLLAMSPFISVFFFHFCVVFCRVAIGKSGLAAAYLLGGFGTLLAQTGIPAHLEWRDHIGWLAVATPTGLVASIAWVILAIGGVSVLLRGLAKAQAPKRQQIAAVTASCLWGLLCLSGYGIVLLDWPVYPFPLLLLPLYPVILVYGILRYGVFVANAWAGRALAWTLLLAVGAAVVALMPLVLPFDSRWLNGMVVAASCLALVGPVGRFAHRLVYPGGVVSVADITQWRQTLTNSASLAALGDTAGQLLSARLGMAVDVVFDASAHSANPQLVAERNPGGDAHGGSDGSGWALTLRGWEAAPPGQRHVAELFGQTVLEAARYVDQLQQRANEERQRQLQARLAELGALAATVAHDIRNPLNIISMAVATAPVDTRREVAEQIQRIAHLSSDLLDYAKPWSLAPVRTDMTALVRQLAQAHGPIELGVGLAQPHWLLMDPMRVAQALTNLLANAQRAAGDATSLATTLDSSSATTSTAGRVYLDVEQSGQNLLMHVCDNGPGVPEAMRSRLFEPFASRSPGGTGLGLAIVARVMVAHGGTAALTDRAGWRTCFTLGFPL